MIVFLIHYNYFSFDDWLKELGEKGSKVELLNDGSRDIMARPGAVGCMALGSKDVQNHDVIYIAG